MNQLQQQYKKDTAYAAQAKHLSNVWNQLADRQYSQHVDQHVDSAGLITQ
jgi:hypothetical protein